MLKTFRQPYFDADTGAEGGGQPSGDGSIASNGDAFTPGWGMPSTPQATQSNPLLAPQAPAQPASAQVFDFAGRKIESTDPNVLAVLKDVHKDYSNLNSTFTQTNQRVKEQEALINSYQAQLAQQQQNAQTAPTQPAQVSEEDLEQAKSDFMESFYDDPRAAIENLMDTMFQTKVQPVIEPISKEREWNDQVNAMSSKYEDFGTMIAPMKEILADMPYLSQHGLEAVYQVAKRSAQAQPPTPEQLLSQPEFRDQVMANPDIQKQMYTQMVNNRQQINSQIPVVMGGQPGGQAAASPENRPTDIRSASKAFLRQLGM